LRVMAIATQRIGLRAHGKKWEKTRGNPKVNQNTLLNGIYDFWDTGKSDRLFWSIAHAPKALSHLDG
jgi:hypothetical protein